MRKANMNTELLTKDSGEIFGINLGWDFCAEHEWGIDKLRRKLGIPDPTNPKNVGIKVRTITKCEIDNPEPFESLVFETQGEWVYLMFGLWRKPKTLDEVLNLMETSRSHAKVITAAWDEGSFGILLHNASPDKVEFLENLYWAFRKLDAAVFFMSSQNPFSNSGLTLAIASKIPEPWKMQMEIEDIKWHEKEKAKKKKK